MKNWFRRLSWPKRIAVGGGGLFVLFLFALLVAYWRTDVPAPNKIATQQSTQLRYFSGTPMGNLGRNRTIVRIDRISKPAQQAVLAAEDRNFYSEPGISPKGISRALFSNVKAGGTTQGGSTITQQYAKNAFLTSERTYTRKIKEVFIAVKMSNTVDKDQILEDYLNTIYFGRGAYGIEAASQAYFHRPASALTFAQAAVLASSIRSPAAYDPARHPERAKERWGYVLRGMVGKGWLSKSDAAAATYPKVDAPSKGGAFGGSLAYVQEQVIAELQEHGFSEDRISAGGLVVRTTIDKKAQQAAIDAVEGQVPEPTGDNPPVGALAAVQPGTGRVVAYYGGRSAGGFDYAGDGPGVQPGSSMKPYVLAAALEKGTSLDTRLDGHSPQEICGTEISNDAGDPPFGRIDLATGLQYSANTVYYRLACETGAERVQSLAHAAGIPDSQPLADPQSHKPTAQIALGSGGYEIHPLDQATGYATFAADGQAAPSFFVESVEDTDKHVLYKAKIKTTQAFSKGVAADTMYAMQKVVQNGTGTNAQIPGRPTAGKTGTTGSNANAWFAGVTYDQLSAAVWIGRPKGGELKNVFPGISGGVYGGTIPAKIWRAFMEKALDGQDVKQFPPRANVGSVDGSPSSGPQPTATTTATPSSTPSTAPTSAPPVVPTATKPAVPTAEPTTPPPSEPSPTAPPSPPAASQAASPKPSP